MTTTTTNYKRFNIKTTDDATNELARLMKTVDDYETECNSGQGVTQVDGARVAMSHRGACRMLRPMTGDQRDWLKRVTLGLNVESVESALMPNRIEVRHFTRSSRVRNLVHGGITGLLAARFMHDPSQVERTSRTYNSACIIRRVNGEAGCEHVKWSIPEFQCRYNIGVKLYKRSTNPFEGLMHDEALSQLNLLDTAENRQAFLDECKAVANAPNQSRVKYGVCIRDVDGGDRWCRSATVLGNTWIGAFITVFSKVCEIKMTRVGDSSLSKLQRSMHLIDLYRFISARIDWILTVPSVRHVAHMNRLWEKYVERMTYMATEGIEHAAYMLARYFPEMMTPELHVNVIPVHDLYRVPEMQIAEDDALFGPIKTECDAFMPAAVYRHDNYVYRNRDRIYSDSDDDYYDDGDNDGDDDDHDDDANVQG
jgi:hypothetical protein